MFKAIEQFLSNSWDVAHGNGPPLVADEAGSPPTPEGSHAHAGLYRDARTQAPVGAAVKLGTGREGPTRTPQGMSGELGMGDFLDSAGDPAHGVWAEGQVERTSGNLLGSSTPQPGESPGLNSYLGYEASLADGSVGVKTTAKSMQLSAQGSGPTFSLAAGTRGTSTDMSAKAGVSPMGPGGGLRFHYGDEDGDKVPEYGVGLDLEWFTGDFKTEDPLGLVTKNLPGAFEPLGGSSVNHTQALKDLYHGFVD